jgi:AcrR family transcriptional regulator
MVASVKDQGLSSLEASRFRASERCCELFISRGTTQLVVAEIADSIEISQRTFYRYFPIKAECVSPVFDWTTRQFDAEVTGAPGEMPLTDVLRLAFHASFGGEVAARTKALMPLVFQDAEMWSVFLRKLHDGERSLGPVLAPRLSESDDLVFGRAAAAAVASSTRIALEDMATTGADPEALFMQTIDAFASGVVRRR